MRIYEVSENKKKYMDLLFLADEQEDMIERYLEKGTMYVLEDDGIKGECVVTEEDENTFWKLKIWQLYRTATKKDMEEL